MGPFTNAVIGSTGGVGGSMRFQMNWISTMITPMAATARPTGPAQAKLSSSNPSSTTVASATKVFSASNTMLRTTPDLMES